MGPEGSEPIEELHELLASETRQWVLRYLGDHDEPVTSLEELAEALYERTDAVGSMEEARVRLHHRDLPKLARSESVQYDARSGAVRYHGNTRLVSLLERGWATEGE